MLHLPDTSPCHIPPLPTSISEQSPPSDWQDVDGPASKAFALEKQSIAVLASWLRVALKAYTGLPINVSQAVETRAATDVTKTLRAIINATPATASDVAEQLSSVAVHNDVMGAEDVSISRADFIRLVANLTAFTSSSQQDAGKTADPVLTAEIGRLVEGNDVSSMVALYDNYSDIARAVQGTQNQPRSHRIDEFLLREFERANGNAAMVVKHLRQMPGAVDSTEAARVIFDCAMKSGNGVRETVSAISGLLLDGGSAKPGVAHNADLPRPSRRARR